MWNGLVHLPGRQQDEAEQILSIGRSRCEAHHFFEGGLRCREVALFEGTETLFVELLDGTRRGWRRFLGKSRTRPKQGDRRDFEAPCSKERRSQDSRDPARRPAKIRCSENLTMPLVQKRMVLAAESAAGLGGVSVHCSWLLAGLP